MIGRPSHRNPFGLVIVAMAMVLVLLAPAHATPTTSVPTATLVGHGHASATTVVASHTTHHGSIHDHAHDALASFKSTRKAERPEVDYPATSLLGVKQGVGEAPEHKPKS